MSRSTNFVVIAVLAMFTLFAVVACSSDDTPSPFSTTTPVPATEMPGPYPDAPADNTGDAVEPGPDIANGESKFSSLGCSSCHSTGTDKVVGPGLAGVGSKGDDYIRESIIDPGAVTVEGFADIMPKTFASLKESDIADLVAYLKTLG